MPSLVDLSNLSPLRPPSEPPAYAAPLSQGPVLEVFHQWGEPDSDGWNVCALAAPDVRAACGDDLLRLGADKLLEELGDNLITEPYSYLWGSVFESGMWHVFYVTGMVVTGTGRAN